MAVEVDITSEGFIMIILAIVGAFTSAFAWIYNKSNKHTHDMTKQQDMTENNTKEIKELREWIKEESRIAREEHAKIYENQNEINKMLHRMAGKLGIE